MGLVVRVHELQSPVPHGSSETPSLESAEHSDGFIEGIEVDGSVANGGVFNPIDRPSPPTLEGLRREELHGVGQVAVRENPFGHSEPIRVQVVDGDPGGGAFAIPIRGADELLQPQMCPGRCARPPHFPFFPRGR